MNDSGNQLDKLDLNPENTEWLHKVAITGRAINTRPMLPKPVLEDPCPATFACLPYLTHLIPLINSLLETARTKVGVSD